MKVKVLMHQKVVHLQNVFQIWVRKKENKVKKKKKKAKLTLEIKCVTQIEDHV